MIKRLKIFSLSFFIIFSISLFAQQIDINLVTEDWAPYNYLENGEARGLTIEIVKEVLKDAKINGKIDSSIFLPWDRAYNKALNEPNVFIFTIGRRTDREKLFKWAFPIAPREMFLFKLKSRTDIVVKTIEDAKKYKIGLDTKEQGISQDLLKMGFEEGKNLDIAYTNDQSVNIEKLFTKRIDLYPEGELSLAYKLQKRGKNYADVEKVISLTPADQKIFYYTAFSISTPDDIVNRVISSYEKLKKNGTINKITQKYLK